MLPKPTSDRLLKPTSDRLLLLMTKVCFRLFTSSTRLALLCCRDSTSAWSPSLSLERNACNQSEHSVTWVPQACPCGCVQTICSEMVHTACWCTNICGCIQNLKPQRCLHARKYSAHCVSLWRWNVAARWQGNWKWSNTQTVSKMTSVRPL